MRFQRKLLLLSLILGPLLGCTAAGPPPTAAPPSAAPPAPTVAAPPAATTRPPTAVPTLSTPTPQPTPLPAPWPTEQWSTSTPEEQGMDSESLAEMFAYLSRDPLQRYGTMSVVVIHHGYLVMEAYFHPYRPDMRTDLYSCTKSVTSMLIGIALARGYIQSLEQPMLDFFPDREIRHMSEWKRSITIEDLLTMRTGMDWTENMYPYEDSRNIVRRLMTQDNWTQFILDREILFEPGLSFAYSTGASHLLSAILQQATQTTSLAFAQEYLFGPLGITDVDWERDPQGIYNGGYGLMLRPRDMAKLGYLYLRKGEWDGQQIVPAEWVEASTQMYDSMYLFDASRRYGYGYQWWIFPKIRQYKTNVFAAIGYKGQFIYVVPEDDVVFVITHWGFEDQQQGGDLDASLWYLQRFILHAIQSDGPLPPNPEGLARLQAEIEAAAQRPEDR